MTANVAIVVGGADCVWDDLAAAEAIVAAASATPTYFAVNDQIALLDRSPCYAVTCHPEKLYQSPGRWIDVRRSCGFPAVKEIWANTKRAGIDRVILDWFTTNPPSTTPWPSPGSGGMYAIKVAREVGFELIVLCGVPMQAEHKHIVRKVPWHDVTSYTKAWLTHKDTFAPYTRSMSGWTRELLGAPDAAFLADAKSSILRRAVGSKLVGSKAVKDNLGAR